MSVKRLISSAATATPEEWAQARRKAAQSLDSMSHEEDAALTAIALADPDNPPILDDAVFMPWSEGRTSERMPVLIDREIVERFRKTGDDWEERLNGALRQLAPAE